MSNRLYRPDGQTTDTPLKQPNVSWINAIIRDEAGEEHEVDFMQVAVATMDFGVADLIAKRTAREVVLALTGEDIWPAPPPSEEPPADAKVEA